MEFNIRKGATLPYLEVDFIKDGKNQYNHTNTNLVGSTIYFYMKNVDTGFYKIIKGNAIFDELSNKIYFQFTKKNTSDVARYEGEFKIQTEQGIIDLPLKDKIYITVLNSISNSDFCCGPKGGDTPVPPPVPAPPGIYYGKVNKEILDISDINGLMFFNTTDPTNNFVTVPEGLGYGYILIPVSLNQPTGFKDSEGGCFGFNIPTNNVGTINLVDGNGFSVTYSIYRTYYEFNGQANIWLCS